MEETTALYVGGMHALAFYCSPKAKRLDRAFEAGLGTNTHSSSQDAPHFMDYRDGLVARPQTVAIPREYKPKITRAGAMDIRRFLGPDLPITVSVPSNALLGGSGLMNCRLHPDSIPPCSYLRVRRDICIAIPELAVLQVANLMSLVELTVLVSMLCGIYVEDPHERGGIVPRRAVCSLESFGSFISSLGGEPKRALGVRPLESALRRATEKAASPAELSIGLRLDLPRHLAGYGLAGVAHNVRVDTGKAFDDDAEHKRYPDITWPGKRVCVEYQSDANHSDKTSIRENRERLAELTAAGFKVFELSSNHLLSVKDMDVMAMRIAKSLRARPFSLDAGEAARREALRREIDSALDHFGKLWL